MLYNLNGNQYTNDLKWDPRTIENIATCPRTSNEFMDKPYEYTDNVLRPEINRTGKYNFLGCW